MPLHRSRLSVRVAPKPLRAAAALLLAIACGAGLQAGEIYRCVASDGAITYTNIACPADSEVQHVSSYEPEPNTPVPAYAPASDSAEIEARIAREAEQARALGYRQAQADFELAAAQQAAAVAGNDNDRDMPVYLPAYGYGAVGFERHGGSHHRHHSGGHEGGPPTRQSAPPGNLPLSTIPFYRPH